MRQVNYDAMHTSTSGETKKGRIGWHIKVGVALAVEIEFHLFVG